MAKKKRGAGAAPGGAPQRDEAAEGQAVQAFEEALDRVRSTYAAAFADAPDEHALRAANARLAGPTGELTTVLKLMPRLPGDRRRDLGQAANALKKEVGQAFDDKLAALARAAREADLAAPPLDVTLPGRGTPPGRLHPLSRVTRDLVAIFRSMGFDVAEGPEADLHHHNFGMLGFEPDHPAADMQDTFFLHRVGDDLGKSTLLRAHTSTVQVRELQRRSLPTAFVAPGAVYRRDDDVTHSPMFFQIEGFLVDEGVSFAHLRGTLTAFAERLFGPETAVRLRPSYFPFVEPGAEVDVSCLFCRPWEKDAARTAACRVCKGTGWLEILGCGMIDPVVFANCGVDPERWTGFAFGVGIDRIAMLRYGIRDIRLLYENDVRFLRSL